MTKADQDEFLLSNWHARQMLERLTPAFNQIAVFVASPRTALDKANETRLANERQKIKTASGFIERHRARVSLELNVKTCADIVRDFCTARALVTDFKPQTHAEDMLFLQRVLEIGQKTQICAAYLGNCLGVLSGREKKLQHPQGPAF